MKKNNVQVSVLFMILFTLFTICLIASNLFAVKPFQVGSISFTGAIFLFPISYIVNDVVAEVWGFRQARMVILAAFLFDFFFVLAAFGIDSLRGAPWWVDSSASEGFHLIFGLAPRVVFASFLAFLVGSFLNAGVMSRMKVRHHGRFFTLRAVMSTLVGEFADSMIFFPIALAGAVIPWSQMPVFVLCQVGLKTTYELVALPITVRIVAWVKEYEGMDVIDRDIWKRLAMRTETSN